MLSPSIEPYLRSLDAPLPRPLQVGKLPAYGWRVFHASLPIATAIYYPALDELSIDSGELPPGVSLRAVRAAIMESL